MERGWRIKCNLKEQSLQMMGFDEEQETQQHPWQASSVFGKDHSEIRKVKSYDLTINAKALIKRNTINWEHFDKVAGGVHRFTLKNKPSHQGVSHEAGKHQGWRKYWTL